MLHKITIIFTEIFVLFIIALARLQQAGADDATQKYMQVKLVLSDSEVFVNDGLAYKAVITNISQSLITVNGPTFDPQFSCVIEGKSPGGDWREIWDYPKLLKSVVRGPIQIPAGETWAEFGQVFLTKGKTTVFSEEGKWELRARVKTVIGNVASDAVPLDVKSPPQGVELADKRFEPYGHLVLDLETIASQLRSDELTTLCKRHPSGGVGNTLKMMLAVQLYLETGKVAGKAATWTEAFKSYSVGLDEVRHDQLARIFAFGAMKKKQWKDVAFLLEQVDDEGAFMRSMRGELEAAIVTGEFRAP